MSGEGYSLLERNMNIILFSLSAHTTQPEYDVCPKLFWENLGDKGKCLVDEVNILSKPSVRFSPFSIYGVVNNLTVDGLKSCIPRYSPLFKSICIITANEYALANSPAWAATPPCNAANSSLTCPFNVIFLK